MTTQHLACPSCGGDVGRPFYRVEAAPTNSCLLVRSRDAAIEYPVAPLRLSFCVDCGFIFNAAWEPARTDYSADYEETQSFSRTFNVFQEDLVRDLVSRHHLNRKQIVEIGCGKGDFLNLLCRVGDNTGLGYDPSFVPARGNTSTTNVRVLREFFGSTTGPLSCDFLCCKMTLEHISNVGEFLANIRRSLGTNTNTVVFFQVPDASRILNEGAFWDIYYEHCSYFTESTLRDLFERSGFSVDRAWTAYDGQYLMVEGRPFDCWRTGPEQDSRSAREAALAIDRFRAKADTLITEWRERLESAYTDGKRILIWGSGSKAVAFLTTVGIDREITHVVDINPYRQGCFMPVTGHQIIAPQDAAALSPDLILVMNPVYCEEIARSLQSYGCRPQMLAV